MELPKNERKLIRCYKYKHRFRLKLRSRGRRRRRRAETLIIRYEKKFKFQMASSCDQTDIVRIVHPEEAKQKSNLIDNSQSYLLRKTVRKINSIALIIMILFNFGALKTQAFCPSKCLCNDQSLSANCTQVSSISVVPMTLNPLLKQLTLNQLPMFELSNSLSVYRQLEYLNLNSNQLKQIKYENFNFKSAPQSIVLHQSNYNQHLFNKHMNKQQQQQQQQQHYSSDTNQEIELTRHLKQQQQHLQQQFENSEDEIKFHLRELDLSDNKIDQLGTLNEEDFLLLADNNNDNDQKDKDDQILTAKKRLKASELERFAPFLTLTKLESLNLSGNRLSNLHQHVFLGLINLKELDLSKNQLEFIDKYALVGLIDLELLKLNQNKLANQLVQLSLAFCRAPLSELRFLDLSDNYKSWTNSQPMIANNNQDIKIYNNNNINRNNGGEILLPNQMFICTPKIVSLKLDNLQLTYIQVNAFDNLQQLENLNLSRNYLEQVPSDALSYSNSNLSSTLRQLDLSETSIEFVNANSFGSLKNLQKLCMNSMQKLVSFDLASFSIHKINEYANSVAADDVRRLKYLNMKASSNSNDALSDVSSTSNGKVEQLIKNNGEFKSAMKSLLPDHLFDRVASAATTAAEPQLSSRGIVRQQNYDEDSIINQTRRHQLINDQLMELQLKHNHRLQSFHSSLAVRDSWMIAKQPPQEIFENFVGGKVEFRKLKLIDLEAAHELRELPLEDMIDLSKFANNNNNNNVLKVDLSYTSKLNCSSCQMNWLIEISREQILYWKHQQQHANIWPPPLPFDSYNFLQQSNSAAHSKISLISPNLIGCSWPIIMPLMRLIELESTSTLILALCQQQRNTLLPLQKTNLNSIQQQIYTTNDNIKMREFEYSNTNSSSSNIQDGNNQQETSLSSLILTLLFCFALFSILAKLVLIFLARKRNSAEFKWRSPSLATTSISSPGSSSSANTNNNNISSSSNAVNQNDSPADCSSSSILTQAAAGAFSNSFASHYKIQQQQQQQGHHKHQQQLLRFKDQLIFANSNDNNIGQNFYSCEPFNNNDNTDQIERLHVRGNLFSRIIGICSTSSVSSSRGLGRLGGYDEERKLEKERRKREEEQEREVGRVKESFGRRKIESGAGRESGCFGKSNGNNIGISGWQRGIESSSDIVVYGGAGASNGDKILAAQTSGLVCADVESSKTRQTRCQRLNNTNQERGETSTIVVVNPSCFVNNSQSFIKGPPIAAATVTYGIANVNPVLPDISTTRLEEGEEVYANCDDSSEYAVRQFSNTTGVATADDDLAHLSWCKQENQGKNLHHHHQLQFQHQQYQQQHQLAMIGSNTMSRSQKQHHHHMELSEHQLEAIEREPAGELRRALEPGEITCFSGTKQDSKWLRHPPRESPSSEHLPLSENGSANLRQQQQQWNYLEQQQQQQQRQQQQFTCGQSRAFDSNFVSQSGATVEGHIYVTLDRPIKQQQVGVSGMAPFKIQPEQQQHQLQKQTANSCNQLKGQLKLENSRNFPPFQEPDDGKSFEWSNCNDFNNVLSLNKPLKVAATDKFKLSNKAESEFESGSLLLKESSKQLAGELSFPLSNTGFEVDLEENNKSGKVPFKLQQQRATFEDLEESEIANGSSLLFSNSKNGDSKEEKMKIYDKNGCDFVIKSRKQQTQQQHEISLKKSKQRSIEYRKEKEEGNGEEEEEEEEEEGEGEEVVSSIAELQKLNNVTNHFNDRNGLNLNQTTKGGPQREADLKLQKNSNRKNDELQQLQQQQLFMGQNWSSDITQHSNHLQIERQQRTGSGGSNHYSSSGTTAAPLSGVVTGSKYDANHDANFAIQPTTTKATTTATATATTKTKTTTATCDDDDYVINGLVSEHDGLFGQQYSVGSSSTAEQAASLNDNKLAVWQMGVSENHRLNNQSHHNHLNNNHHNDNNNQCALLKSNDNNSSQKQTLIGQQNGLVSLNCVTDNFDNGDKIVDESLNGVCLNRTNNYYETVIEQQHKRRDGAVISSQVDYLAARQQKISDISQQTKPPLTNINKVIISSPKAIDKVSPLTLNNNATFSRVVNQQSRDRDRNKQSNGTSTVSNGTEIYSNQFYYCKPSNTNTLKGLNAKSSTISNHTTTNDSNNRTLGR